jgi:trans-aconitate 2-methyltransferase
MSGKDEQDTEMREWDPQQYLQFKHERTQPAIDLVARIQGTDPKTIIDIGCGPGNSTQILLKRWPHASITGLDNSEKMIQRARQDYPNQKWVVGDASRLESCKTYDIVFSNAAIHWIPKHDILIPRLFQLMNQNGMLAVQVPANQESPLFRTIKKVSKRRKWSAFTSASRELITYHGADYYYNHLVALTNEIAIWETIYYHVLNSHQDLVDWYKGTAMKPFLDSLPTDESREEFEKEILAECKQFYAPQSDGRILYPFKRLFFTARKLPIYSINYGVALTE